MSTPTATQTIQIRVDAQTKQSAESVLMDLGLNMSQAIKLYLKQISLTKSIPFSISLASSNYYEVADAQTEKEIGEAYEDYKQGRFITINNKQELDQYFKNL